ncbi:unnamed protein product [Durusdinium trenchii]|uniref:Uncharacterized protein n=1 Tax=Durusdinium trenchii TaxID=1381693 RepID=A0ABP0P3M8_9DINO
MWHGNLCPMEELRSGSSSKFEIARVSFLVWLATSEPLFLDGCALTLLVCSCRLKVADRPLATLTDLLPFPQKRGAGKLAKLVLIALATLHVGVKVESRLLEDKRRQWNAQHGSAYEEGRPSSKSRKVYCVSWTSHGFSSSRQWACRVGGWQRI